MSSSKLQAVPCLLAKRVVSRYDGKGNNVRRANRQDLSSSIMHFII